MKKLLLLLALLPSFLFSQGIQLDIFTWVNVEFQFDDYAEEVSWSLSNNDSTVVIYPYGSYEPEQPNAFHLVDSLEPGDYTFELLDSFGDGLSWPNDGYCLVSNACQDTLFFAQGDYGIGLIESLTIAPCAPPTPAIVDCMDENAINYNPNADVNDLMLCEYPPCESIDNIYVEQTCDGGSAILYYNWDISINPNCNITQITYGSEDTNAYTFDVNIDNGIWGVFAGNGQMPPNWEDEFYAQFTTVDSLVSDTIFFTPYPCTQGCTDENAPNYNPWANVDDGSCGGQACEYGYTPLTIEITLDNWPGETGWSFVSGDGSTDIPDGTYTFQDVGQTYTYNVCAMESGFEFIISDTYGDGLAGSTSGGTLDGDVLITGCNGDTITSLSSGTWVNANQENIGIGFGNVAYSGWQEVPVCGGPEEILGCLDSDYQEFNPFANVDDGSCLNEHVFGCINENAFNYNPDATQMEIYPTCNYELWIGDAGADGWGNSFLGVVQGDNQWSFTMGPGEYEQIFPIWLETDKPVKIFYFEIGGAQTPPEEVEFQTLHNSFKLTDQNGVVLMHEGWNPFADNGQGALQPFAPPFYQTYEAMPFCGTLCIPTIEGCLDSTALNYNEEANTDDGSCIEIIPGCTQEIAFNYDENANFDDGSCVAEIVGCMDLTAWNYNEEANVGDDSCLYFGCIDSEATPGSGQPLQVIVPPQSGVTENTFVTVAAAPNCVYKVGVETQNNSTTTINTVLTNISSCLQICNTYTITGGTGGGSYSYKDCGGTVQSGNTVAEGVSDQVCAQSISTTNTTNTMDCSCLLTWEVERCQIDNTGVKPIEYIVQDGVVQIGDIVTLTGEGECTYNVLQSSSNAATATLNSIVAECACNEYTIENPSPTETRTFFYTDCDDQVQTLTLIPTSVQIRCIKSFTQPQQFNVAFYSCGCPILP